MEEIRFTPYYHNLRFTYNDQNLGLYITKLNLRVKRRRGRGGQKGVGAWRFQGGLYLTEVLLQL